MRRAVLLLALLLAAPLALASVPRAESQPYTSGEGEVTLPYDLWPPAHAFPPLTMPPPPTPMCPPGNVGGACFTLDGSERSASVVISDAVASSVSADAQAMDHAGRVIASAALCHQGSLALPSGSATLRVLLYDQALGALVCGATGKHEPTTGTIQVAFT